MLSVNAKKHWIAYHDKGRRTATSGKEALDSKMRQANTWHSKWKQYLDVMTILNNSYTLTRYGCLRFCRNLPGIQLSSDEPNIYSLPCLEFKKVNEIILTCFWTYLAHTFLYFCLCIASSTSLFIRIIAIFGFKLSFVWSTSNQVAPGLRNGWSSIRHSTFPLISHPVLRKWLFPRYSSHWSSLFNVVFITCQFVMLALCSHVWIRCKLLYRIPLGSYLKPQLPLLQLD